MPRSTAPPSPLVFLATVASAAAAESTNQRANAPPDDTTAAAPEQPTDREHRDRRVRGAEKKRRDKHLENGGGL